MRKLNIIIGLVLLGAPIAGARAQMPSALRLPVGDADLTLSGTAQGAVFSGPSASASGAIKLMPKLQRDYDSGLSLSFTGVAALEDPLSRGRYDGDAIEKAYGEARTGLGQVRIGLADGAAYDLAVSGPRTDPAIALDDAQTTFFRDPSSGRAVTNMFALRTPVGASSNYAKIVYQSPALFGAEIALSFTPSEGKAVLPFLREGPQVAGRQADMWEGALRYSDDFGPVTVSASGGAAFGRAEHKLPGQEGVSDYGAGARADYAVNDDLTLSLGVSWRQSNAYAFDINRATQGGTTRALDASAGATYGDWSLALEYGNGVADRVAANPRLGLNGSEASVGYTLSPGVMLAGGWQHLAYGRDAGNFFNAAPRLSLDAAFLHLSLATRQ